MAVWRGDDHLLFEKAVRSVFANTLLPDELVLVVDGPVVPPLAATIEKLELEFGLNTLRLPENVGLARALNAGLEMVKTEWIVRADADDFNLPERFARLAKAINCKSVPDLLGSAIVEVELDGTVRAIRCVPLTHVEIVQHLKYRNPFNHMTIAYRRELALKCGGYPEIYLREDYALWALMLHKGAVSKNLAEVLVHATAGREMYRRRGGWRYALGEIQLQRHLVACQVKGPLSAFLHGVARSLVFLLPIAWREWVYKHFLRGKVVPEPAGKDLRS
jgi:glycosyltransferase involved in cell wall biosynthesis